MVMCKYPSCDQQATTKLGLCNDHTFKKEFRSFRDSLRNNKVVELPETPAISIPGISKLPESNLIGFDYRSTKINKLTKEQVESIKSYFISGYNQGYLQVEPDDGSSFTMSSEYFNKHYKKS